MSDLTCEVNGKVAEIVMDRPHRANALDHSTITELLEVYDRVDRDPAVHVVTLRGAGKGFSSGHDLGAGGAAQDSLEAGDVLADWNRLFEANAALLRIWDGDTPVIALVHGYCMGAATELVMMCDLALGAEDCRFSHPALRGVSGMPPDLPHIDMIGLRRAKEYLWVSEVIDGRKAAEWGLLNKAVPADALFEEGARWAARIAAMPRENIRMSRRALHRIMDAKGFRTAFQMGVEFDVIAHRGPATAQWIESVRTHGFKEAVRLRDAPFED